jgi:hypothetical protein
MALGPCSDCGKFTDRYLVLDGVPHCPECAAKQGMVIEPHPATREATIKRTQCWTFTRKDGLEQVQLSGPETVLGHRGLLLRKNEIIAPDGRLALVIYSEEKLPDGIAGRALEEAKIRWKSEPWDTTSDSSAV